LFIGPEINARQRRTEHEGHDPLRAREDVLESEHAAPRRAEQMDSIEPELLAERAELLAKDSDAPLDVRRLVRAPAADLVVKHHRPLFAESVERREVVMCRARTAMEGDERHGAPVRVAGDAVPGSVAAEGNEAFVRHERTVNRMEASDEALRDPAAGRLALA
jgi:hypothetical protein